MPQRTYDQRPIGSKPAQLIQRTKELLETQLANPIRLVDIGRTVGASPVYLTELFRRVEGMSLHQYLIQRRLARARAELPYTDDLTALALEVGFSSHSHFTAAFRRVFGCTPSQFRRSARRGLSSGAVDLPDGVPRELRVPAHDGFALGVGRDGLDVVEPVRRARLDEIDHPLGSSAAIGHDDLAGKGAPLRVVRRERLDDRNAG